MGQKNLAESIKEYSTLDLKEILERKRENYSAEFIELANIELYRRGEITDEISEFAENAAKMDDNEVIEHLATAGENTLWKKVLGEEAQNRKLAGALETASFDYTRSAGKYGPALLIANMLNILGWFICVAILLFIVFELPDINDFKGLVPAVITVSFVILVCFGLSTLIKIGIDVEKNTRPKV